MTLGMIEGKQKKKDVANGDEGSSLPIQLKPAVMCCLEWIIL